MLYFKIIIHISSPSHSALHLAGCACGGAGSLLLPGELSARAMKRRERNEMKGLRAEFEWKYGKVNPLYFAIQSPLNIPHPSPLYLPPPKKQQSLPTHSLLQDKTGKTGAAVLGTGLAAYALSKEVGRLIYAIVLCSFLLFASLSLSFSLFPLNTLLACL